MCTADHPVSQISIRIPNSFLPLFRYTFPEIIVSNRGVRNAEGDFARNLRNALVYGIRYDAELYVCRRALDANPAYADIIGRCCRKLNEYGEFYFDGLFTVHDTSPLPPGVVRGEFLNKDGTKLLTVLHNASGKTATVNGVSYPAGNLSWNITSLNDNYFVATELGNFRGKLGKSITGGG